MLKVSASYLEYQTSFISKKIFFWAVVNIKTKNLCVLTQFSQRFWCRPIKTGPVLQKLPLSWSFNYANEFLASNCTLQMFTGIYGVPIDFFCNIYVKGL